MFLPLKLLELYVTQNEKLVSIDFDKCYAEHLIRKKEVNDLFGLNVSNDYRIFLPGPATKIGESILTQIKRSLYPLLRKIMNKKIAASDLAGNTVVFTGDKNVYKISRVVASCNGNEDYTELVDKLIACINRTRLYTFEVTRKNIVTCLTSLCGSDPNRKYVITTNFIDFLLSSNTFGWSNCMRVSGSYALGPTSLSMDGYTFILGIVNTKIFTKRYGNRWISRRWGYYNKKDGIGLNRVFGHSVCETNDKIIENIVNNVINHSGSDKITIDAMSSHNVAMSRNSGIYLDDYYSWYYIDNVNERIRSKATVIVGTGRCISCGGGGGARCNRCGDKSMRNPYYVITELSKSFDELLRYMQIKKENY